MHLSFFGLSLLSGSFFLFQSESSRDEVLELFEAILIEVKEMINIPAMSVGIVYKEEIIYQKAFGVKDIATNEPVDIDTLYQIGSITKAFTGTLLAIMVDQGYFRWKERVIDLYPDFRLSDPVAQEQFLVEDLLAQNSGLPSGAGDNYIFQGYSRQKLLDALAKIPFESSFRSRFGYVNIILAVVEEILERINGNPYFYLLQGKIFEPLGMFNT